MRNFALINKTKIPWKIFSQKFNNKMLNNWLLKDKTIRIVIKKLGKNINRFFFLYNFYLYSLFLIPNSVMLFVCLIAIAKSIYHRKNPTKVTSRTYKKMKIRQTRETFRSTHHITSFYAFLPDKKIDAFFEIFLNKFTSQISIALWFGIHHKLCVLLPFIVIGMPLLRDSFILEFPTPCWKTVKMASSTCFIKTNTKPLIDDPQ
jgi:hypothetical protein